MIPLKKVLTLLLVMALCLCLLPTALAAEASGDCGAEGASVTWRLDADGTLTIAGSGDMKNYSSRDPAPWKEYRSEIKAVVIENGVTHIGNLAFWPLQAVESIRIAPTVRTIGESAVSQCFSLTELTIPEGVEELERMAIEGCDNLKKVSLPASLQVLGEYMFTECSSLASIEVAAGNSTFRSVDGILYNSNLTKLIQYPAGREGSAFTLPETVEVLSNSAFDSCNLEEITLSASLRDVGSAEPFGRCHSLRALHVAAGNAYFTAVDGVLFSADMKTIVRYPAAKTAESYTVPASVTTIGFGAFYICRNLTAITLPASLQKLERWSFAYCEGLTSLVIPDGVTALALACFGWCRGLTEVTIPASVTKIEVRAFESTTALTDVYYGGTEAQWNAIEGKGKPSGENVTIHFNSAGPGETPVPGDVDGDGEVTAADAAALFAVLCDPAAAPGPATADLNADGKVNNRDAILLFRRAAGRV